MNGVFITGTDTNVGKTWVGKQLIKQLCTRGINVTPRKPIESGWTEHEITQTDAWILANAANKTEILSKVCPHRFKIPVSPDRAAKYEGTSLKLETLRQNCIANIDTQSFLFVEGAGGFYSPLCSDALNADLMTALNLPIILVAEDKLGCINHVLLTIEAIKKRNLSLLAIVLNKTNDCENNSESTHKNKLMDNHADLTKLTNHPIISVAYKKDNNKAFNNLCNLCIK